MKKILVVLLSLASFVFGAININTASKDELQMLPNIGPSKADKILEYRSKNKFKSIDELKNVKGIGQKTFDKLKEDLSISGETDISNLKSVKGKLDNNKKADVKQDKKTNKKDIKQDKKSDKK